MRYESVSGGVFFWIKSKYKVNPKFPSLIGQSEIDKSLKCHFKNLKREEEREKERKKYIKLLTGNRW